MAVAAEDQSDLHVEQWLTWMRVERGLAPATIQIYKREIEQLAQSAAPKPVHRLSITDLRKRYWSAGGSNATRARRIGAWRSLYKFLVRSGVRKDNPTDQMDRPKVKRGVPRPVRDFEAKCAALPPKYQPVAMLLRHTGLRIAEACSLDLPVPCPLDTVITGKGSKERLVIFNTAARAALDELGGHMPAKPRAIQRAFAKVGMKPHGLRHLFACELAEQEVDLGVIQDLLGHASPATTRIYQRNSVRRLRAAVGE